MQPHAATSLIFGTDRASYSVTRHCGAATLSEKFEGEWSMSGNRLFLCFLLFLGEDTSGLFDRGPE